MDIITTSIKSIMKKHMPPMYFMRLLSWIDRGGIAIIGGCCVTGKICETCRGDNVTSSFLGVYATGIC
jgi:hypothetical protein